MQFKLAEKSTLTDNVFSLGFSTTEPLSFTPGQAVKLQIPDPAAPEKKVDRYYSIASPPEARLLEICVKKAGAATAFLDALAVGSKLSLDVPMGDFCFEPPPKRHLYFVGMGTGIAPLRSMILSKSHSSSQPLSSTLVVGAREESGCLYQDDIKGTDCHYVPALTKPSDKWAGFKGRVTDYFEAHKSSIHWDSAEFYMCGSGPMVLGMRDVLLANGVAEECIHHEAYLYPKKL